MFTSTQFAPREPLPRAKMPNAKLTYVFNAGGERPMAELNGEREYASWEDVVGKIPTAWEARCAFFWVRSTPLGFALKWGSGCKRSKDIRSDCFAVRCPPRSLIGPLMRLLTLRHALSHQPAIPFSTPRAFSSMRWCSAATTCSCSGFMSTLRSTTASSRSPSK